MKRQLNLFLTHIIILAFLIGGLPGASLAQQAARPKSPPLRIISKSRKLVLASGEKRYTYLFLSASSPLTIAATGPLLLKANVRLNFDMKSLTAKKTGELRIYRDQKHYSAHKLEWKPSKKVSYPESSGLLPSVGNVVKIEIPPGEHRVRFALSSELSAAVRLAKAPLAKTGKKPPAVEKKKVVAPAKPKRVGKPLAKRKEVRKPIAAPQKRPPIIREKEVLRKPVARKAFQISTRLDCGYDSNIIQLSSEEQDNFDSSLDQFKIESVSDFIIVPRIDLQLKKELLGEMLTELKLGYDYSIFSSNSIKNYSNIGFSARQQVFKDTTLSGGFCFIPSFYLRQLFDSEGGQYKEAAYRLSSFSVGWEQVFLKWLLTTLTYRWEARDYGSSFDERDQTFNFIEFVLTVKKIKSLKLSAGYSYIIAPAYSPSAETDVSYDGQAFSFGAGYDLESLLEKKMGLGVEAEFEYRKFTASNDDPIHSGRKDGVNKIGIGYYWHFLDSWALSLDYELTLVKTNKDVPSDEPTDYSENLILLGLTYHLPTFGPQVR
jgi:hypothetical protein